MKNRVRISLNEERSKDFHRWKLNGWMKGCITKLGFYWMKNEERSKDFDGWKMNGWMTDRMKNGVRILLNEEWTKNFVGWRME